MLNVRTYWLDSKQAEESQFTYGMVKNCPTPRFDCSFIDTRELMDSLQEKANKIADVIMKDNLGVEQNQKIDRSYHIGEWDILNELITELKKRL